MSLDCFFRAPEQGLDRAKAMQVLAQLAMNGAEWVEADDASDWPLINHLVFAGLAARQFHYRFDAVRLQITQKGLDFLKEDV